MINRRNFVKTALVALATAAIIEAPHLAAGYTFGRVYTNHGYTENMFDKDWNSQTHDARAYLIYPGVKLAYRMYTQ